MKKILALAVIAFATMATAFAQIEGKLISKTGHISFYSHTAVEDITANNYKVISSINTTSGEVVFSVPMQAFEFEKALMQKHYNSKNFLNTKKYPKSKFKGSITNLSNIDFTKNGTYNASINGTLEMHGVTKAITESGTITVKEGNVTIDAKMNVTLADYKIAFKDGKPSTNIAKTIEITIKAIHTQ